MPAYLQYLLRLYVNNDITEPELRHMLCLLKRPMGEHVLQLFITSMMRNGNTAHALPEADWDFIWRKIENASQCTQVATKTNCYYVHMRVLRL